METYFYTHFHPFVAEQFPSETMSGDLTPLNRVEVAVKNTGARIGWFMFWTTPKLVII